MASTLLKTFNHWKGGIRLYVAIAIAATTAEVWWWANSNYAGSSQYASHLEEVYAWLALSLIALAVSIGPFFKLFPRVYGKSQWFDARRLLGVGGAWFASLHVLIAYDSLFRFANPLSLPSQYQRSFVFGGMALIVLLAMAATSFDKAFKSLGKWWFRLHRLVYVALLAILVHIFIIGVHATERPVLLVLTFTAVAIIGMHTLGLRKRRTNLAIGGVVLAALAAVVVFNYGYTHMRNNNQSEYSING